MWKHSIGDINENRKHKFCKANELVNEKHTFFHNNFINNIGIYNGRIKNKIDHKL